MSDEQAIIELHGWDDIIVPTDALFALSARAYVVYCYLLFRERRSGRAWPGVARMVSDLSASGAQEWSESSVKRALRELEERRYIYRQRRVGQTSVTHVFRTPADYERFMANLNGEPEQAPEAPRGSPVTHRRFTHEPTVGSPMNRQNHYTDESIHSSTAAATGDPASTQTTSTAAEVYTVYEQNIGPLTPMIAEVLGEYIDDPLCPSSWIVDAIREAAEAGVRRLRYVTAILDRWKVGGRPTSPPADRPDDVSWRRVYR